ncbi:MAG: hypothetical protein LQ348_006376 [Seirophora lacunosa]|nr:MAG: hypothetical protein LQ348_006376 [Seirophora lacunosa]
MYLIHMRLIWLSSYVLTAFCANPALRTATQLGSFLSPQASIYLPGSSSFDTATQRWQDWQPPKFLAAVEVATVQFANLLNLPFLAVTGGHGSIGSLGKLNHGIEIWMRKLNATEIAEDGRTVQLGGGLLAKEITDALWADGKQTVTGLCECVGNVGAMLGGGHGILQGRYGLIADNLLSAEVVLANGSLATASSTSHPDLFWALRGAGHNFGIVTSYRFKIYDVPPDNSWTVESYVYTEDKLEQVLELTNTFTEGGKQPVEYLNWAYYLWMPDFDADHVRHPHPISHLKSIRSYELTHNENAQPVIQYTLLYEGTAAAAAPYASQYRALGPVNTTSRTVRYLDLPSLTGNGNNDFGCQHGYSVLQYPISLQSYNITAHRAAFGLFEQYTREYPGLNGSFVMNEGYSLKGVQSVPAESTGYPDRDGNLLIAPIMIFFDQSEEDHARQAGSEMRRVLLEGSGSGKLNAYVNYVSEGESLQEIYGHEPWRIEKLKELKKRYDPKRRFGYFAPIA